MEIHFTVHVNVDVAVTVTINLNTGILFIVYICTTTLCKAETLDYNNLIT